MATHFPPLPPPAELAKFIGPMLMSTFFIWGLLGVLSIQIYIYYLAFPKDNKYIKALVYVMYIIELAQTIMITEKAFNSFAYGYGNLAVLQNIGITWFSVPILGGIVAFITQAFYAFRISVLAQNKYASAVIMLLACVQLAGALAAGILGKQAVLQGNLLKLKTYMASILWEGGSALCDVVIAGCMTYYLRRRRDTGVKETRALVQKITRLTIETGTLTATVAIVTLILTFLPGKRTYYQTGFCVLGKLYSNSMMVSLNSRMKIGITQAGVVTTTMTTHEIDVQFPQAGVKSISQFEAGAVSMSTRNATNDSFLESKGDMKTCSCDCHHLK